MRVLFATDGSAYSETAAHFLTRFNWTPQDTITVFHAVYAPPFPDDHAFHADLLASIKKELAPRILDTATAALKPLRAAVSVEIGDFAPGECTPDQCIVKAAESTKADLIVLGASGIKGLASVFLGSVTRLVTMHAATPVLVVKPAAKSPAGAMKILFAIDQSGHSRAACEFLTSLPFSEETQATILHVITSGFADIPERFSFEISDRIKDAAAAAGKRELLESERIVAEARAALGSRFHSIDALSKVGDPSTEIVNAAASQGADIVVAGCRGLRGIRGMLGSVSRNILTHAPCSVLIGKPCSA